MQGKDISAVVRTNTSSAECPGITLAFFFFFQLCEICILKYLGSSESN